MKNNSNVVDFPTPPIEQILSEGAKKVRNDHNLPAVQRNCLAAILDGDYKESDRLLAVGKKMNELGITAI